MRTIPAELKVKLDIPNHLQIIRGRLDSLEILLHKPQNKFGA